MLCVLFRVKNSRFALEANYVVEVTHRVNIVDSAEANSHFEGLICYRGELIPLLDFCLFYSGIAAEEAISSRIIVLESLDERKVGLLAEGVVEIARINRGYFVENPLDRKHYAYITGLWHTPTGVLKNVDVPLLFDMCYQAPNYGG